ncbi:MAG: type II toxin-antitoxin system VapC family toxin [Sulfuricurvum sp.]|jgi:hypothetical protein|uniref:type II toxin-antitoxin system VapC family toxin n=1 Tax=Sulfuricurvum sp. TaxID=2025608 RepID=UPI0025E1D788|nr:type II toxin-antitoxin system VapC family toxin [Sulfuricurvum sp.]MCK9372271.1 type II toxin-antitoxin system VapC family toxin [Sulfuricurvum sp.]
MSGCEMTLLDSNTLIYLSKGLLDIDSLNDDEHYGVSVITYMEVLGYTFTSKEEEEIITKLFLLFEIIYIDEEIVKKVIDIRKQYPIKLPDAIICATAIQQNAVLYTNDIRLKSINGLNLQLLPALNTSM